MACGVVSQTEPEYVVYFREADLAESAGGDALRAEPVSVEGGNTVRTAQQLMEALLAGHQDETLQSTIPAGTQLLLLNVEGGQARVDLSSAYANLSGIRLTMADYAIALTLTQLPEIFSVKITVRGQELAYRDKQIFAARDVLLSPRGDVVSTVTVQLYFRSEAGELVPEERVLELYEGDTQVGAVVRALENGPEEDSLSADHAGEFPRPFRVAEEDVCYVNLSSAPAGGFAGDGCAFRGNAVAAKISLLPGIRAGGAVPGGWRICQKLWPCEHCAALFGRMKKANGGGRTSCPAAVFMYPKTAARQKRRQ